MPYPMVPAITFGEFKNRLCDEFGCSLLQLDNPLHEIGGGEHVISYLERRMPDGDDTVRCIVTMDDDEELMLPNQIRHMCACLRIFPAEFGLVLVD